LSPAEVIAAEERRAVPVGIATLAAAALVIVAIFVASGALDTDSDAAQLRSVDESSGQLLLAAILRAIGVTMLCIPLFSLFRSAQARTDAVRPPLVGFCFIGPLIFGVQSVLSWVALDGVASDFVPQDPGTPRQAEELAERLLDDSSLQQLAAGLLFPALLGLIVGVFYTALWAMRVGLLTRFWGTLGMALGVSIILVPFGIAGLLLWFAYVGLLIAGWLPGERPPAWAAGEAVPWPSPGEEVEEEPSPPAPAPVENGDGGEEGPTPSRPRRKRKRRR
jgi:hypothetical protein